MSWRRAIGGLAVVLVIAMALGAVATVLSSSGLLRAGPEQIAALASLGLLVVAFVVVILAASPSRDWVTNPYW